MLFSFFSFFFLKICWFPLCWLCCTHLFSWWGRPNTFQHGSVLSLADFVQHLDTGRIQLQRFLCHRWLQKQHFMFSYHRFLVCVSEQQTCANDAQLPRVDHKTYLGVNVVVCWQSLTVLHWNKKGVTWVRLSLHHLQFLLLEQENVQRVPLTNAVPQRYFKWCILFNWSDVFCYAICKGKNKILSSFTHWCPSTQTDAHQNLLIDMELTLRDC